MRRVLGNNPDAAQVKEAYRAMKGVALSDEEAQMVVEAITKRVYRPDGSFGIQPDNTLSWAMVQRNAQRPDRPNIGWSSGQHTASPVLLALYGQGLRLLNLGLLDNTHVFRLMGEALGIRYQNPVMSEEEALEILKARPTGVRHPEDIWA